MSEECKRAESLARAVESFLLAMKDCGYTADELRTAFAPYAEGLRLSVSTLQSNQISAIRK